jgi:hypothetical protein
MDTNIETFIELMDAIFWEGYSYQLSKDNPTAFKVEFENFISNYN